MANYPDWVLKYKKKGTYINHSNGKYYLYAGHSERVKGTKKVRRICDGYLGRITEKDGLIPPKDKVSGDVEVFEYGLCSTIMELTKDIHSSFKRSFKTNADFIMVCAVLKVIYGVYNSSAFNASYLSIIFPTVDVNKKVTNKQIVALNRGILMIKDTINKTFGDSTDEVMFCLRKLYKLKINQKYYISKENKDMNLAHYVRTFSANFNQYT